MKKLFLNSLLVIVSGFTLSCDQDDNSVNSNTIDCSTVDCSLEPNTIIVFISREGLEPVFLESFKVIEKNTGTEILTSESELPTEFNLEPGEYPVVLDGSIVPFTDDLELEFIGFINETAAVRSTYLIGEGCCGINLLSGDLELIVSCETFIELPGNIINDCTSCISTPCPPPSINNEIGLSLRFNNFNIGDEIFVTQTIEDYDVAFEPDVYFINDLTMTEFNLNLIETGGGIDEVEQLNIEIVSSYRIIKKISNIKIDLLNEISVPGQACPCGSYEISTINIDDEIIDVNSSRFIIDIFNQ